MRTAGASWIGAAMAALLSGLAGCGPARPVLSPKPAPRAPVPAASPTVAAEQKLPQFPALPPGPTTELTLGDFVERLPGPVDGVWLAYAGRPLVLFSPAKPQDRTLEIWDLAKGTRLTTFSRGNTAPGWDATASRVALGCSPTRVYETTTGRFLGSFESPRPPPPKPKPRPRSGRLGGLGSGYGRGGGGVAYAGGIGIGGLGRSEPQRKVASDACSAFIGSDRLLTIDKRGSHVWSLKTGKRVATAKSPSSAQYSIAADPRGKTIAVLGSGELSLLSAVSLKQLRQTKLSADSVAFSPDGKQLALAGQKGVKLLGTASLEVAREVPLPDSFDERPVTYSSDGMTLFTLTAERLTRIDAASGNVEPARKLVFDAPVSSVGSVPERGLLVTTAGARVQFWDSKTGSAKGVWQLSNSVHDFVAPRGGESLVVAHGSALSQFALSDLSSPKELRQIELPHPFDTKEPLSLSPDGALIGVPGVGIFKLPGLERTAQGLTSDPRAFVGSSAVLTRSVKEVAITNLDKLDSPFREDPRLHQIEHVAWSKLGWVIASAGGSVRVMQRESGELLRSFSAHYGRLSELIVSPDGRLLATAAGREVRVWDLTTGLAVLAEERRGDVTSLAFSHDSARLLSAGQDRTLSVQLIPKPPEEPAPPAPDPSKAAQACEQEYARLDARKKAKKQRASQAGILGALSSSGLGSPAFDSMGGLGRLGSIGSMGGEGHYEVDQSMSPRKLREVAWKSVGLGRDFRCGLTKGGLVLCSDGFGSGKGKDKKWGPDDLAVIGVGDVKELAVGDEFACARSANGEVRCWGKATRSDTGETYDRPEATPIDLPAKAKLLAAGREHACAALVDGSVWCWGDGASGQLGSGTAKAEHPVQVCGLKDVEGLALGFSFSCAIVGNGEVACWGRGLGGDSAEVPVELPGVTGVEQLAAGTNHVCALAHGRVRCWGAGKEGQLGNGKKEDSPQPVAVDLRRLSKAKPIKAIYAGGERSCARFSDGSLACWGDGTEGQLGNGASKSSTRPVRVSELKGVTALATSGPRTCAIANHELHCWGLLSKKWVWDKPPTGILGERALGGGSSPPKPPKDPLVSEIWATGLLPHPAPARHPAFDGATSLFATFGGVCALIPTDSGTGGEVRCQSADADFESLFEPGKLRKFIKGSSSLSSTCLIESGGQVTCQMNYPRKWQRVPGVERAVDVSVGYSNACAVSANGRVTCWRSTGSGAAQEFEVESISGVSGARRVEVGEQGDACALTAQGEVYCWGGYRLAAEDDKPAPVTLWQRSALSIASAPSGVCAVLEAGEIACRFGQYSERVGAPPRTLQAAKAATFSPEHGCVLLESGEVSCWGSNTSGQLGRGRVSRPFAAVVSGVPKMKQVVAVRDATCALDRSGQAWCWGAPGE